MIQSQKRSPIRSFLVLCGLGLALLSPAACGGSSSDGGGGGGSISTGALTGKIGGTAWTFMSGQTNSALSDANGWWVELYEVPIDSPCTGSSPSASTRNLILTLPKTVGSHALSLDLNETFYIAATSDNLVATAGTIQLISSDATTIHGAAKFQYNADNTVDGQFTANICP
jgi:hypothetical protein